MPAEITTFAAMEVVTATMHTTLDTGESYMGPIHIGVYQGSDDVWLEQEGKRVQFSVAQLPALIAQLRRAAKRIERMEQVP